MILDIDQNVQLDNQTLPPSESNILWPLRDMASTELQVFYHPQAAPKILHFILRSVKIGVMEVGEELARRGHQVTVISPHKYKEVPPGVREIVHESGFDALTTATTEEMLSNENAGLPFVKVKTF